MAGHWGLHVRDIQQRPRPGGLYLAITDGHKAKLGPGAACYFTGARMT